MKGTLCVSVYVCVNEGMWEKEGIKIYFKKLAHAVIKQEVQVNVEVELSDSESYRGSLGSNLPSGNLV